MSTLWWYDATCAVIIAEPNNFILLINHLANVKRRRAGGVDVHSHSRRVGVALDVNVWIEPGIPIAVGVISGLPNNVDSASR